MFKSKIHRAIVTEANLNYMGSITIDRDLMDAADILPNEKVQVVNNNNGARFETYVIEGTRGSGTICLNGAAARLVFMAVSSFPRCTHTPQCHIRKNKQTLSKTYFTTVYYDRKCKIHANKSLVRFVCKKSNTAGIIS